MSTYYDRFRPVAPDDIADRRLYTVGGGLAALAAAFVAIRDAGMPGSNITILEMNDVPGGGIDGAGTAETGYILRGGREMEPDYNCFWDLFQDVPAFEMGEDYSVLDEFHHIDDVDPNYSNCRLIHHQGQPKDNSSFGLTKSMQRQLVKVFLAREEDLQGIAIDQFFEPDFLKTNFWYFWRTMFAFHDWESLIEMKRYMHRFMHCFWGFKDMSVVKFCKYNQYDAFIKPLRDVLASKGVTFRYRVNVTDLDMDIAPDRKVVRAIVGQEQGEPVRIEVDPTDLVLVTNGSLTECTGYGTMDTPAPLVTEEQGGCWNLWRNLAAKDPSFGHPDVFTPGPDKTAWESFTITCHRSALTDKIAELSGRDPFARTTATGGIITVTDSNWLLSFTVNRQPQFPDQPDDVIVVWGYGLLMDTAGNHVHKTMPECTGAEILEELCHHLGLLDHWDEIREASINIPTMLPYITSFFQVRRLGDRPQVVPEGSVNLGFMGEFVETPTDCSFTLDSAIRTGEEGVYQLLGLNKHAPDMVEKQYDIRYMVRALRSLNDGVMPGDEILGRLARGTYYEDLFSPAAKAASLGITERGVRRGRS